MPSNTCTKCNTRTPIGTSRCKKHTPTHNHQKTNTQRGYGRQHQKLRATLAPAVNNGETTCHRCHLPIHPGQPWDLGHHDTDRRMYTGPEHAHCNRARRRPR